MSVHNQQSMAPVPCVLSKLKRRMNISYLVSGYSRRCCSIPSRLSETTMNLIFGFLPKMNGNVRPTFEWNIKPTLSSPVLPSFDSNTFDVGLPNVFFLRLQSRSAFNASATSLPSVINNVAPNPFVASNGGGGGLFGQTNNTNGNTTGFGGFGGGTGGGFNFGNQTVARNASSMSPFVDSQDDSRFVLLLMSFPVPPSLKNVIVHFEMYCAEIDCHFAGIWNLGPQHSVIQNTPTPTKNTPFGGGFGGQTATNINLRSAPWTLPSSDIAHLLSESGLSFECRLNVLKITRNQFVSGFGAPQPSPLSLGKSVYVHGVEQRTTPNPIRFIWNITGSQLLKLGIWKKMIPMNALQINSTVFGGMFQLKLWRSQQPNQSNRVRGGLSLWITLCGIPKGTAKMGVKFEISARDHSKGADVLMMSEILTFSFEAAVFPLTVRQNAILQQMASDSKGLTLICRAIIIQKVDEWNNLVPLNKANADGDLDNWVDGNDESERKQDERAVTANKKEMVGVKREFVEMEKEEFLWKITKWESVERLKALNLDDQYLSAPFILFGLKWYLSIQSGNSNTRSAGWNNSGVWGAKPFGTSQSNNVCDTLAVHLNPLIPSMTSFDCRVSLRILQTGRHCRYYGQFCRIPSEYRSLRQQTDFVTQNIADLKGFEEISILVSMEKVNEVMEEGDGDKVNALKMVHEESRLPADVKFWLSDTVKLPEYGALFARHGIDSLDLVKSMNADDLREMGICRVGHLIRFRNVIKLM